jgi:hypothetical protein
MFDWPSQEKVGTYCLLGGSVAVLGFGVAHGVLPEDSGHDVLRFVADHPHYAGVHLGSIIGVVLWTIGIVALTGSFDQPVRALAWPAAISTLIGTPVFVIQFAVDGYGHHALASLWEHATPPERESLAHTAELVDLALEGPAFAWLVLLWGIPLILIGLAVVFDRRLPAWLGWPAVALGAAIVAAAFTRFLQSTLLPDGLIFAVATFGAAVWGIALGITLWRTSCTHAAAT